VREVAHHPQCVRTKKKWWEACL